MATKDEELLIVREIALKYGSRLDLEHAPFVLAEILRNYGDRFAGRVLDEFGSGAGTVGGGTTGVGGVTGGVTGGTTGTIENSHVQLTDIMRGILQLQRSVSVIDKQLKSFVGQAAVATPARTRATKTAAAKAKKNSKKKKKKTS